MKKRMMIQMMKSVAAAGALLLLVSCGKDDTEPASTLTISPVPGTLTFGSNAEESYRFEVTGPEWQAISDQPWCKVEMDAEAGTFTVTAEENNETTAPAPATITVTAGNAVPLTLTATQAEAQYDIYMAGGSGPHKVCYWKNGQMIPLELPDQAEGAMCFSICTSDNSVYIGGFYGSDACYWKDGKIHLFPQPEGVTFSTCQAIAVSEGKVYGTGDMTQDGMISLSYWADTFLYRFDPNPERNSYGTDIALSDGSIHLSGLDIDGKVSAFYLKLKDFQEEPVPLESLPGYHSSRTTAIAVSDGKVYIAGYSYNPNEVIAGYWLDGVFVPLEEPSFGIDAQSEAIAVENGIVHIAGTYLSRDKKKRTFYWNKEQGLTMLPQPEGSTNDLRMLDIVVFGDKVFISGSYFLSGVSKACYWIDGERFDLDDPNGGDTYCTAMTVVKR